MTIDLKINGHAASLDVAPTTSLLDALRGHGHDEVKWGCHEGACGSCTVTLEGRPVASCLTMAGQAHGRSVETVRCLGTVDDPHPLQQALVDHHAVQCGFCTPGMLLAARALLAENPDPTEAEVARALDGNLCRCTGYTKIVAGVLDAARVLRGAP